MSTRWSYRRRITGTRFMTMMACAAGKDVYVEKPLSLFPREGRWMVEVARRHNRVVQVGTQQRSGPHYQSARELIQGGRIGQVVAVRMWHYRNVMPGFGSPAGRRRRRRSWITTCGSGRPRSVRYNPNRALYHFRWFWDYSGGQMTNLGQHSLDIVHWFLDATAPAAVTSAGGRFAFKDNGETPDRRTLSLNIPGGLPPGRIGSAAEVLTRRSGSSSAARKGSLKISRKGFVITPDPEFVASEMLPRFGEAHPVGGPVTTAKRQAPASGRGVVEDRSGDEYRPVQASRPQLSRVREISRASRSRTLRGHTASRRLAIWRTCRCGWAGSCGGMRRGKR